MSAAAGLWARPALIEQVLRRRHDGRADVALHVPALAVPASALRLEQHLRALPAIAQLHFDIAAERLRLTFDDAALPLAHLLAACAGADCPAEPLRHARIADVDGALLRASLKRLALAGVFAMQAMMFALVLYIGALEHLDATTAQVFRWLGMLAAIPVVGYAAWPFYRDALAGLRARRPGIDIPVALAIVAIFVASAANVVRGAGEVYFDSVSMFTFVLLLGRHLALRAQRRHRALGELAADATPLTAVRLRADGGHETIAAAELAVGDRAWVAEGAAVPCDGTLESDGARLDESILSGESRARWHGRGDAIAAGSVALDAPLVLRVTRVAAASTAGVLAQLAAQAHAPRDAAVGADARAARRFVWRVLVLALATAAFWLWRNPAQAFDATVAVLVVACPCAFGLAAPAVLTRAMAMLAGRGVLVLRPAALGVLARADRALVDKTGTLTAPALRLDAIETFRGLTRADALRLAGALAQASRHPLAQAVVRAARVQPVRIDALEAVAGGGVRGRIEGRALALGRPGFVAGAPLDDDALWLADADGALARLPVTEAPIAGARAALARLGEAGLAPALVSGDAPTRVRRAALALGIDEWSAQQSPADKLARVQREQASGRVVLAVGDGSNDAAALAAADVSAVPADGTALARRHADLVLRDGIESLPLARAIAVRARAIVRQNRRGSLAWNLGAVPLAALGFVPPWLAMLGMAASSLAVVLNALRVRARPAAGAPSRPPRACPA